MFFYFLLLCYGALGGERFKNEVFTKSEPRKPYIGKRSIETSELFAKSWIFRPRAKCLSLFWRKVWRKWCGFLRRCFSSALQFLIFKLLNTQRNSRGILRYAKREWWPAFAELVAFNRRPPFPPLSLSRFKLECNSSQSPPLLPCPPGGKPYIFSGSFRCEGLNCPAPVALQWTLTRLRSTVVASGVTVAGPVFSINILPAWYATPGLYTLQITGVCGSDSCRCRLLFRTDCSPPCPCTPQIIQQLA